MDTSVVSFGFKHGLPLDADLVFDCRFLPNPHWVPELRALTGLDRDVRDYVLSSPESKALLARLTDLFELVLPAYAREGKSYLSDCHRLHRWSAPLGRDRRGDRRHHAAPGIQPHRAPSGPRALSGGSTVAPTTLYGVTGLRPGGPAVVAIGGGHGLSQTLRAVRRYAGRITAIVSVADDGGSSGRLRADFGIPAPGDLRKCLGALLPEPASPLAATLEHRFDAGALTGHAFGNLLIAALAASMGSFAEAVAETGRLLGALGLVLPATIGPVDLKATGDFGEVDGQVRIMATTGVRQLSLVPPDAQPPAAAVCALKEADQVIIGPGSLYTSVLAACCVPQLRDAITASSAQRVYVANLREQPPETAGYDVATHMAALARHGVLVDVVLADPSALPIGDLRTARVVRATVGGEGLVAHDPARLASELEGLLSA